MALTRRQLLIVLLLRRRLKAKEVEVRRKKECWVRRLYTERTEKGEYHQLVREMKIFDKEYFFQHFRMGPEKFEEILSYVAPKITKCSVRREPIGPSERLCVTLRYLVTGDAQTTIAASYRMSRSSVSRIIKETSDALWSGLMDNGYLKAPEKESDWLAIADDFERKWNFGNCIGAIDGKHVIMQAPARSGSQFFNYKKSHSIVLMAIVNANYEFILVDIGEAGRQSDGGVFSHSNLGIAFEQKLLKIPKPRALPGSSKKFPFVLVGDEAFPLKDYLVNPYSRDSFQIKEKIANYRISRARRQVENVFGICASRFRIFRRPIIANVETVISVTKAVVAIHNYLMAGRRFGENQDYYWDQHSDERVATDAIEVEGGLLPLMRAGSNNYSKSAKEIRDDFRDYFCSEEGSVPWQWETVLRTRDPFDEH